MPTIVKTAERLLLRGPEWLDVVEKLGLASPTQEEKRQATEMAKLARPGKRRGRKGYSEAFYRRIAIEYLALTQRGFRGGLYDELARLVGERLGRPVASSTIKSWVRRARELGLLPLEGKQGRISTRPGPNL